MSHSVTIYNKTDIEQIVIGKVEKLIEPYQKIIDDLHVRMVDLERMKK